MASTSNSNKRSRSPEPTSSARSDATFTISSGAICFGSRLEVWQGSQTPIQTPSFISAGVAGTVLAHSYPFNFAALNGTWHVSNLWQTTPSESDEICCRAAFCSHESLENPWDEAQRILQVANAPWEKDHGTRRNTEQTWEGRVLVVNRYDWGEDYETEAQDGITVGEEDQLLFRNDQCVDGGQRNSRFLVDYQAVQQVATAFKEEEEEEKEDPSQKAAETSIDNTATPSAAIAQAWVEQGHGHRLVVFGEYIYGRFGLTEDRSRVQSCLLFTGDSDLSRTHFAMPSDPQSALSLPLYQPRTPEQRHQDRLADGSFYTGYDWLRTSRALERLDLVGPFGVSELFSATYMNDMLAQIQPVSIALEPALEDDLQQLMNESLGAWVFQWARIAASPIVTSRETFLQAALPKAYGRNRSSVHARILQAIQKQEPNAPKSNPLSIDLLHKIVPASSKLWTWVTAEDVSCGIHYLLGEILELAGNCARDHERNVIVPLDIRISINNDPELCEQAQLNTSKVFWPPDMVASWEARRNEETNETAAS